MIGAKNVIHSALLCPNWRDMSGTYATRPLVMRGEGTGEYTGEYEDTENDYWQCGPTSRELPDADDLTNAGRIISNS
jgi:hypothetical protein